MSILSFKNVLFALLFAAAFLFISEVNSNPTFFVFPSRGVGSFEYIRIGEKFLDKGIYDKAISYYEKAHESSPENEEISSEMLNVYTKYAYTLMDAGKYDKAIEYLTKAYNVKQYSYTIQNLAIMYTKKALKLAEGQDLPAALDLLRDARRLAYGSYTARKNLGLSLANDGVAEFKKGNEENALLFVKESSLIYQDSRMFKLLGDIYYKRRELVKALFYWRKAKRLNPADTDLTARLKRVTKEIELSESQAEAQLAHFEIIYAKDLHIDKNLAAAILEKAYFDVGRDLDYYPKSRTGIYFYSREDFKNIFKMNPIVMAFYDGNIRIPVSGSPLGSEEFSRYVYHEYTHALVSAKTNNNCPVWFSEGVAQWEEFGRSRPGVFVKIDAISLDSLNKEFQRNEITPERAPHYFLSYTVVAYIVDNWGMAGLQDILKRLADKQHIINAIDDEFLLSEREFERRWKAYLKNKYFAK